MYNSSGYHETGLSSVQVITMVTIGHHKVMDAHDDTCIHQMDVSGHILSYSSLDRFSNNRRCRTILAGTPPDWRYYQINSIIIDLRVSLFVTIMDI